MVNLESGLQGNLVLCYWRQKPVVAYKLCLCVQAANLPPYLPKVAELEVALDPASWPAMDIVLSGDAACCSSEGPWLGFS
jgi:hypothetical protein